MTVTAYIERAAPPAIKTRAFYTFATPGDRVQANEFDQGSKPVNTLQCPRGYAQADSGACIEFVATNAGDTPTSTTRYPQADCTGQGVPYAWCVAKGQPAPQDCDATYQHCPCDETNPNECPDKAGAQIPAASGCAGQGICRGTAVAAVATSAKVQPTIEVTTTAGAGKDRRVIYGDSDACCSGCQATETCTQPADCTGAGTPHAWCNGAGDPVVRMCYCDSP